MGSSHDWVVGELITLHVVTITEEMSLESPRLVGIVARRDLVFGYMKALAYWS
jgi:hypothetical protein